MKHFSNLVKIIIAISLAIVMYIPMYITFEYDKEKELVSEILAFQDKYSYIISDKDMVDEKQLYEMSKGIVYPENSNLIKYQENLEDKVYTIIDQSYNNQERLFKLMNELNITNLDSETATKYNELINLNRNDLTKYQTTKDVILIDEVAKRNNELLEIVQVDYSKNSDIIEAFEKAKENENTTNKLIDDCFTTQTNDKWKPSVEISTLWCKNSGLDNCNTKDLFLKDEEKGYSSFSMNNPKQVNSDIKTFEYVSYSPNYVDQSIVDYFSKYTDEYTIYLEVFEQEVNNTKIYKYNAIPVKSDYELSCSYEN